ncbi:MAG: 4-(cytidine 5'-diphospho)-2-C-methyl-D-erythritol kinase [Cyclobacteriaceae bacterium]
MLSFPNAKINLGLHITAKRPDGFHDLETCLYPVGWCDILEVIQGKEVDFTYSGLPIEGDPKDNLCFKAYELLQSDCDLPPIQLQLHKGIPLGAGLGGGSADAASTLLTLNKKFSLNLDHVVLKKYAAQLGSDCPFFIDNTPSFATGKGDTLEPANVDLTGNHVVIVNPGLHISTAQAYSNVTPRKPSASLREILDRPLGSWKETLVNDFEENIFRDYPEIKQIKKQLYDQGAFYSSMSGSGASVYGLFDEEINLDQPFPPHYKCFQTAL